MTTDAQTEARGIEAQARGALTKAVTERCSNFDKGAVFHWAERDMYMLKADHATALAAKDAEIERLRGLFTIQSNMHREHVKGLLAQQDNERDIYGKAAQDFRERAERAENQLAEANKALDVTGEALDEFYQYWTGGEMRGSYDGKPERDALWKAMYAVRAIRAARRAREQGGE